MRAPIKIKTKDETYNGTVPTTWDDITLEEFYTFSKFAMKTKKDFVQFYADMTGIPYEILFKSREGSVQTSIDALLSFLFKDTKSAQLEKRRIPVTFKILIGLNKRLVTVPRNLELKQLGQKYALTLHFEDLKKTIKDPVDFQLHRAAGIIAIFMFQEFTGKADFDLDQALLYKWRVMKLPAVEMVPLAVFFWNSFISSASDGVYN